jgi:Domain of unknown function DUF11/Beta-propeller repeat
MRFPLRPFRQFSASFSLYALLGVVLFSAAPLASAQTTPDKPAPTPAQAKLTPAQAAHLLAAERLHFESAADSPSAGQAFTAAGPGYGVRLTSDRIHLNLLSDTSAHLSHPSTAPSTLQFDIVLAGAHTAAPAQQLDPVASTSSYFVGDDPTAWRSNVPQFSRLRFRSVYPGIDVLYHGNGSSLEHDFVVAPHADPSRIHLHLDGVSPMLDPSGDLVLNPGANAVRLLKPIAYQPAIDGAPRREVPVRFELLATGNVRFSLGDYDHRRQLIIDPTLTYASYFGNSNTVINGIAVDGSGNIFIAGLAPTYGITTKNAPLSAGTGTYNAFLAKLDPTGANILFSTYIGGGTQDEGLALALDPSGNAYVAGLTSSTNFPTLHAAQANYGIGSSCYSSFSKCFNGFVTAVKSDGSALLYSTYLGGSVDDRVEGIAVDSTGAAYLTGYTKSGNFPLKNAYQSTLNTNCSNPSTGSCQDAFVTKLDATGALVFSTYLGGTSTDNGVGIALDAAKNIYIAGLAGGGNFPIVNPLTYNGGHLTISAGAFITEMAANGQSLVFSDVVATGSATAVAVDSTGVYVSGSIVSANSASVPITTGAFSSTQSEMYAFKLKPDGSALLYATYLGGISGDLPTAIVPDAAGDAYIAGFTDSTTFPTTANALQPSATNGFVRSTDGGVTFAGSSSGLPSCTPAFISIDPGHAGNILTSCSAALYLSNNSGASWSTVTTTGLSGTIVSGFRTQSSSTTLYILTASGVYKSIDNGVTWAKGANTGLPTLNGTSQTIVGDPANSSVVYFTQASVGQPFVFRSADGGATFTSVSTGLPSSGNLSFLVPDTTNAGTLYAAISSKIYKTTNSGTTWTLPNSTGVPYAIIGLSLDPSNTATVYVGTTFSYFKSTDGATTFTAGNSSFSFNAAIAVDPTNSNTLYARATQAGYYGIYKSTDGGAHFSITPFTNTAPTLVVIDPTNNSNIYVGTSPTPTAFLAELDPNGANLLYSSYYGGIGWTEFWALAVSGSNIYAAGLTNSANNTTTNNGAQPNLASTSASGSPFNPARVKPADDAPSGNNNPNDPGTGSTFSSPSTGPTGGVVVEFFNTAQAALTLTDTVNPASSILGAKLPIVFTLDLTNTSFVTANKPTILWTPPVDMVPAGGGDWVTVQTPVNGASIFSCTGTLSFICTAPSMPGGGSIQIRIYATAVERAGTTFSDSTQGSATNAPYVYASSTVTVTTPVADLAVAISGFQPNGNTDEGTLTVSVTNNGPTTSDVLVEHPIISANLVGGFLTGCDIISSGSCYLKGVTSGQTRTMQISVYGRASSGTATVTITVSGLLADPNMANNTAMATFTLAPVPPVNVYVDKLNAGFGVLTLVSSSTVTPHLSPLPNGGANTNLSPKPNLGPNANLSGVTVDSGSNFWVAAPAALAKFDHTGTFVNSYTGGGLGSVGATSTGIAIDGASSLWITNSNNTLSQFNNTGTALSPATGYGALNLNSPAGLAVDRAGTVWIINSGDSSVTRVFGGATPVISTTSGTSSATQGTRP